MSVTYTQEIIDHVKDFIDESSTCIKPPVPDIHMVIDPLKGPRYKLFISDQISYPLAPEVLDTIHIRCDINIYSHKYI